jgi:ABC-type phosphate transport system substrate-binding protein
MARITIALGLAGAAVVGLAGQAEARDQIRIVGSSTVFPFSTAVAEQFGNRTGMATPVVESTGTGGGVKLFCAGVGEEHPDITNASRRIKDSEVEQCGANGVKEITEVKIGFDGIVLANSKGADPMSVDIRSLWLALAKEVPVNGAIVANPYQNWSEIAASLPDAKIEVLGPPPTSGTRDAFVELVMDVQRAGDEADGADAVERAIEVSGRAHRRAGLAADRQARSEPTHVAEEEIQHRGRLRGHLLRQATGDDRSNEEIAEQAPHRPEHQRRRRAQQRDVPGVLARQGMQGRNSPTAFGERPPPAEVVSRPRQSAGRRESWS